MSEYTGYFTSPLGLIEIRANEVSLTSVNFMDNKDILSSIDSPIIKTTISQLNKYFDGSLKEFNLPLEFSGSEFQKKVWAELLTIPYGHTISYGELAKRLGSILTVRAVGSANGKNPIAIIIPCHRVIGHNGSLTGYAGGLWRKKWLLERESSQQTLKFS